MIHKHFYKTSTRGLRVYLMRWDGPAVTKPGKVGGIGIRAFGRRAEIYSDVW